MLPHPSCSCVRSSCASLAAYCALATVLISLASTAKAELPLTIAKLDRTTPVEFDKELMPILKRNCLACHHKANAEGGLVLESHASFVKGGDNGPAIVAKDAASSLLMTRVTGQVEPMMPPEDNKVGAVALTAEELGLLQLWIEQGASGSDEIERKAIMWQPIAESMRSVYAMDISPDGQYLAFGRGNRVMVADLDHPTDITPLVDASLGLGPVADVDLVQSIAFSPDGTRIATGGFRTVRLWKQVPERINDVASQALKFVQGKFAQAIAFDSSHASVALINAIGDIEVWDTANNARRAVIGGQRDRIVGLAWAGAPVHLLVANEAGSINVYDGTNGEEIAAIDLEASLECLSVCNDGVHVAVIDQDRRVQLLRMVAASGEAPASITILHKSLGDIMDANAIAFLSKPAVIVMVASESRGLLLIDPATNQVSRTIEVDAIVDSINVSIDETKLATASRDHAVRILNVADGKCLVTCQGTGIQQLSLAKATRDAKRQKAIVDKLNSKTAELQELLKKEDESLATITKARDEAAMADQVNEAKLKEAVALVTVTQASVEKLNADNTAAENVSDEAKAAVEKATKDLETHRAAVTKAEAEKAKSAAERMKQQSAVDAATSAQQRATAAIPAHQSNVATETRRLRRFDQMVTRMQSSLAMTGNETVALALSADATQVATIRRDGLSVVYRTSDGLALNSFPSTVTPSLELLPKKLPQLVMIDHGILRRGRSGAIECFSLRDQWQLERTIGAVDDAKTIVDRVTALDFRPDGMTLAVGTGEASRSGIVKIFAVQTGEVMRDLGELHTDTVLGLDFSPDGNTLASSAADRVIRLVDVARGITTRTLEGHTHHVLSVAWQDDGRTLASAGADQSIKIWDSETGETLKSITGFSQELTSIKFVDSTDHVVASCGSGQVRLANATSGATVRTFDAAKDFLFTVALTPDGKRLAAGGQSGIVRLWNVADGATITEMKP